MIGPKAWARIPTGWIQNDLGLHRFRASQLGESIAGLKLYLVISSLAGSPRKDEPIPTGSVSLTYDELEYLTSMSRPMISPGLDKLEGLVSRKSGKGRRPTEYSIVGFPETGEGGWAKMPSGLLMGRWWYQGLSNRSPVSLSAMKLLLVLVTFRNNVSGATSISYEKIGEYTKLNRNQISNGRSELIAIGAVTLYSNRDGRNSSGVEDHSHNRYFLNGLGRTSPAPSYDELFVSET